ncbi:MAG: polysaccharide biosynthesis C-terminal domain-containing protein [Bacteroidales bacterium]|nr:polysaccharide biosynthesis C-terminal domain-containing protein [Bacteroidales bacterium]
MGIIQKQAISGTIFTFAGVAIGFVTSALIFPRFLSSSEIGLFGILLSYSLIFGQFATLGTGRINIMLFPQYKNREKYHYGFFFIVILISIVGLILAFISFTFLRDIIINNSKESSELFISYINYLYPLIFFTFLYFLADSFNTALFDALGGLILKEFVQRILILLFILPFIFKMISFHSYAQLFVVAVCLPSVILPVILLRKKEFRIKVVFDNKIRENRKLFIDIGIYGIIIGFTGLIVLNIDRIMVERFLGLSATGVYTTMAYFATLVSIPSRALAKISDPIIAQHWKENDLHNVRENYYRSSINQFLIGCLILVGIWGNIDNILTILPPEFATGKYVILFIGLAFLSDMSTGTSSFILANSVYYKYQAYIVLILVVLIVITNYLLIPLWGLPGAALATLISKIISNMMRHFLLFKKFNLQPFNSRFLLIIGISLFAYLIGYIIPAKSNLYLDLILRSSVILILFVLPVIIFRLSPETNQYLLKLKKWIQE